MSKIQNVHIPAAQKNFAINGALDFWQEKGGTVSTVNTPVAGYIDVCADSFNVSVSEGTHKVALYWRIGSSGTASTYTNMRTLTVEEI